VWRWISNFSILFLFSLGSGFILLFGDYPLRSVKGGENDQAFFRKVGYPFLGKRESDEGAGILTVPVPLSSLGAPL
jgi:hypothetical protein